MNLGDKIFVLTVVVFFGIIPWLTVDKPTHCNADPIMHYHLMIPPPVFKDKDNNQFSY